MAAEFARKRRGGIYFLANIAPHFSQNRFADQQLASCSGRTIEVLMGPKPANERADHGLFHTELLNLINQRHEPARVKVVVASVMQPLAEYLGFEGQRRRPRRALG